MSKIVSTGTRFPEEAEHDTVLLLQQASTLITRD